MESSCWRCAVALVLGPDASSVVHERESERLLDEDAAVLSVACVPLRRWNSVWKDAIDDKRRSELRRHSGCVSLELLLRDGMMPLSRRPSGRPLVERAIPLEVLAFAHAHALAFQ